MAYKVTRLDNKCVWTFRTGSEAMNYVTICANEHYVRTKQRIRFKIEKNK